MRTLFQLWFVFLLASTVAGQSLENANALSAAGQHAGAAREFRAVVVAEPSNGPAWYGLGRSLQALGEYDEAIEAFDRAGEAGFQPGGVMFRKGSIYIEKGELDKAMEWLQKASDAGVPIYTFARSFPSFAKARSNAEFQEFMNGFAPCVSEDHRRFDFWIGDWDVYNPATGQKAGVNLIEPILDGCVLQENWTGAGGSSGKSFNRWDSQTETWNQHWVTDSGTEMMLVGSFRDGRMVLETPEGVTPKQRWTWYEVEPGKVRQRAEQTTDGETWSVTWDSVYIPKGTAWQPIDLD